MSEITFTDIEKKFLTAKLQAYFENELDQELDRFGAEFLLTFISKEMGNVFYNRGLYDARAILMAKIDEVTDAIYDIEKPTKIDR